MKSPIVRGNVASSDTVNGSMPRSSSSRATRIAKLSESKPVSWSDRSSTSGDSVTCCSTAICCIADTILDLTDMDYFTFYYGSISHDPNVQYLRLSYPYYTSTLYP